MTPLHVDRESGEIRGTLECGHSLSQVVTRTRDGDQVQVCEGCERKAAMAPTRAQCIAILRNSVGTLCIFDHRLGEAVSALLAELESPPAPATEFPSERQCIDAVRALYSRHGNEPIDGAAGAQLVHRMCLASRAPKVEWPAWFGQQLRVLSNRQPHEALWMLLDGERISELLALQRGQP